MGKRAEIRKKLGWKVYVRFSNCLQYPTKWRLGRWSQMWHFLCHQFSTIYHTRIIDILTAFYHWTTWLSLGTNFGWMETLWGPRELIEFHQLCAIFWGELRDEPRKTDNDTTRRHNLRKSKKCQGDPSSTNFHCFHPACREKSKITPKPSHFITLWHIVYVPKIPNIEI